MKCQRCKNAGFQPVPGIPKPLIPLRKEKLDSVDLRDYVCLQCGYVFKTEEKFYREVEIRGAKIMKMIEDAKEQIQKAKIYKKAKAKAEAKV